MGRKLSRLLVVSALSSVFLINGCTAEATIPETGTSAPAANTSAQPAAPETSAKGPTIAIEPNSPADTVRVFYKNLRERKFRDALFLTNLRPAIEGLTDDELKEYQVDFEAIAKHVPAEIQINGEIVSGDKATVTAKLPNEDLDKEEIQEIRLRREGDVWVILTVDETAENRIKKEGKNYFRELKIDVSQDEARDMLDRVAKAQMVYATQNKGLFGDMAALIAAGFLPEDIRSSTSTGYNYSVTVSADKKKYSAAATPAVYGKTGRLAFSVQLDAAGQPHLTSRDAKGK
jgi:hypothetical protein